MKKQNPLSIKKIEVEKLFGYYDYLVPLEKNTDISQLLIIYGDNGSGKTTLLKLLFWVLSSRNRSGYKSKIAETRFKSFAVQFENGIEIGVRRQDESLIGSYSYYVKDKSKFIFDLYLKTTPDNGVSLEAGSPDEAIFLQLLNFIKNLNISVFYLSDDRKILNSITSSEHDPESTGNIILNESDMILSKNYERLGIKKMLDEKKLALEPAIERLIDWIRTKIISGSKTGEKNSQVIYTELIKNVLHQSNRVKEKITKEQLLREIDTIEKKVLPYAELGLIERFDSKTIKSTIAVAKTPGQFKNLRIVLAPFIDSINAKLKAQEGLKDTISLFLTSINDYFTNKHMSFNLAKGFLLKQTGGDIISFNLLSSGEKQLLLLFINTITSAEAATIFIIDEPEISLNIKWQRKLIKTLLKFSSQRNIQYILSTHSLELLSSNLENVTKLESKNGSDQKKIF